MKYIAAALIRFYRKYLSPLKRHPTCRFTPTCSAYALEAYLKRGFLAGTVLTVSRICRCNPFCAGGYDPVPEKGFRRCRDCGTGFSLSEEDAEEDVPPETDDKDRDGEQSPSGNA